MLCFGFVIFHTCLTENERPGCKPARVSGRTNAISNDLNIVGGTRSCVPVFAMESRTNIYATLATTPITSIWHVSAPIVARQLVQFCEARALPWHWHRIHNSKAMPLLWNLLLIDIVFSRHRSRGPSCWKVLVDMLHPCTLHRHPQDLSACLLQAPRRPHSWDALARWPADQASKVEGPRVRTSVPFPGLSRIGASQILERRGEDQT